MTNEKNHPKYELPDDPHAKYRYESAMKHVQFAKEAGKSSEEIHEMFHKIMNFDINNLDAIPADEGHRRYRHAMVHAKKALENGKTSEEAHHIFKDIMSGSTKGHCHA